LVVLSLQDSLRSDADQLTPFTPRPLTLHTEGSRRPAAEQPLPWRLLSRLAGGRGPRSVPCSREGSAVPGYTERQP
jgi:hypothetical protein